jgi:hypothetical protein
MHSFLVSIPIAVVLWALMLFAVAVAVVLAARPRGITTPAAPTPSGRSRARRSSPGARSEGRAEARSSARSEARAETRSGARAEARSGTRAEGRSGGRAEGRAGGRAEGRSGGRAGARSGSSSAADDLRFADEVTVAAERAAATADRCRARWETTQQELDAAWTGYEEADAVARRTWAATSFPQMSRRRKLGDNADRERYLHRAATAACRERELSIAQLNDVYAHRGWNPRLHPVVQEALLRNAIRENAFGKYQAAQRRERAAWQEAESAAEALRALRAEAAAAFGRVVVEQPAADEFWWSEQWTTGELPVAA